MPGGALVKTLQFGEGVDLIVSPISSLLYIDGLQKPKNRKLKVYHVFGLQTAMHAAVSAFGRGISKLNLRL